MNTNSISIIIPIYNESRFLEMQVEKLITGLKYFENLVWEIVLVENGSTDNTYFIAKNLAKKHRKILVFRLEKPSYGEAIRLGIIKAQGEFLVQFDIDFIDLKFLINSLRLLRNYDIIAGSKLHPKSVDQRPLQRILVTRFVTFLIKRFFGYKGSDTHGIKAFRKESIIGIIKRVKSPHLFFDTELLLRAQYLSKRILEVPVEFKELRASRFPLAKSLFKAVSELFVLYKIKDEFLSWEKVEFQADDLGYKKEADERIRELILRKKVARVSVLATHIKRENKNELKAFLKKRKVALHANLIEGKPVGSSAHIPSLVDKRGFFYPSPIFIARCLLGLINEKEVRKELEEQILYLKSLGAEIVELNSHQHTHAYMPVADVVQSLSKKYKIASSRPYGNIKTFTFRARVFLRSLKILAYLSNFFSNAKFALPPTWRVKGDTPFCFMSWESNTLRLEKLLKEDKLYRLVIHPELGYDKNLRYKEIIY